jgi:hypothetical protein
MSDMARSTLPSFVDTLDCTAVSIHAGARTRTDGGAASTDLPCDWFGCAAAAGDKGSTRGAVLGRSTLNAAMRSALCGATFSASAIAAASRGTAGASASEVKECERCCETVAGTPLEAEGCSHDAERARGVGGTAQMGGAEGAVITPSARARGTLPRERSAPELHSTTAALEESAVSAAGGNNAAPEVITEPHAGA